MTYFAKHSPFSVWLQLEKDPELIEVRNVSKWVRLRLASEVLGHFNYARLNGDFAPTPTPGRHRAEPDVTDDEALARLRASLYAADDALNDR